MTVNIAVCDDDEMCRDRLYEILMEYSRNHDVDLNVDRYSDGGSLIRSCSEPGRYSILFMDIEMPGISGIDAVLELRNNIDKNLTTVFVSSYSEYMGDGFAVHPYQFIQKPFSEKRIYEVMDDLISDMRDDVSFLDITDNSGTEFTIKTDNICYIESTDSKRKDITYHLVERDILTRGTLSQIEEELDDYRFVRCSRSSIVNLSHVYYIKDMTVHFDNNLTVTVSRRCKNMIREQYVKRIVSGKRG